MKAILGPLERMLTALRKTRVPSQLLPQVTLVPRDLIPSFGLCGLLYVGALIHMHIYKHT